MIMILDIENQRNYHIVLSVNFLSRHHNVIDLLTL